jgi:ABC-type glycerol-3-phosphate transport system substrate-binding protein
MWMRSTRSIVAALAVCVAVAACAGLPVTASSSSDLGSQMQAGNRDIAKWGPGPDNGRY